jgi:lysophospholipase L1-like esterase
MKIAFYGDSLTTGIPGASYFAILKRRLPEHTLLNYGKINDTPFSLYRRIQAAGLLHPLDMAFIFVGVNDLLIERSWLFSRIRRRWARTDDEFRQHYEMLLDRLSAYANRMICISPLFIGEDFDSMWQQRLGRRADLIARLTVEYPHARYLDLRSAFARALASQPVVNGVGQNLLQSIVDGLTLRTDASITRAATARRFHYTLDGVHLNVAGAQVVADACRDVICAESAH